MKVRQRRAAGRPHADSRGRRSEFVRELGNLREFALRAVREERHLSQELRSVTAYSFFALVDGEADVCPAEPPRCDPRAGRLLRVNWRSSLRRPRAPNRHGDAHRALPAARDQRAQLPSVADDVARDPVQVARGAGGADVLQPSRVISIHASSLSSVDP
jgi:hypothetical protein